MTEYVPPGSISVLPETEPFVKLKAAIPLVVLVGPPSREIWPVGVPVPDFGATDAVKFTACPCVIVVGFRLLRVVVDGSSVTEFHFVTRLLASTEPNPVAKSYPAVELYPLRTP